MEASTSTILKQKLTSISNGPYPLTVSPPMFGGPQETRFAERARQEARLAESLAPIGGLEISIAIRAGIKIWQSNRNRVF